ncbi:hypothetical protein M0804_009557 [Polistes exclamans]|nr:hypothetical protein M0804_009557 [Polistes exclamans]
MRYENEDGRNKSDVEGSSESFLKAPGVTRQIPKQGTYVSQHYHDRFLQSGFVLVEIYICRRDYEILLPDNNDYNDDYDDQPLGEELQVLNGDLCGTSNAGTHY